ncbi:YHYH protein [archaeon]|nr:MAG: YHYH protein [archaeon]
MSAGDVSTLNNRPKAATDFNSGHTTAVAGQVLTFGEDIGYNSNSCDNGFWPPGPGCPSAYSGEYTFTIAPAPETQSGGCYIGGAVGYMVSGAAMWSWGDANSYNSQGVWHNLALEFERYDMDLCYGHAAMGVYHHHSYSPCLADSLDDDGTAHSPVYGFAYDGFPIYGPYHSNGVKAVSCWSKRDYASTSPTGCSDSQRSCMFVDNLDYTQGVTAASSTGPTVGLVSSIMSSNTITLDSGVYYEDFYYNSTCFAQGGEYLNANNGHDHDGLGFHYHTTVDATGYPAFPYSVGPQYYGCRDGKDCPQSAGATGNSGVLSQCGTSPASLSKSCVVATGDSESSNSNDDDGNSMSSDVVVGMAVGISAGSIAVIAVLAYFVMTKSAIGSAPVAASAVVVTGGSV